MNMIEQCARALCAEAILKHEALPDVRARFINEMWPSYVEMARATIAPLFRPTPEMLAAALPNLGNPSDEHREIGAQAFRLLGPYDPTGHLIAADLVRDWQAMLGAIDIEVR